MKRLSWILMLIFLVFVSEALSKAWKTIVPSVSTRLDAEKILGKGAFPKSTIDFYKSGNFRVTIVYERNDHNDFNKDVVQKITVYPNKSEPLTKLIKEIPDFPKGFSRIEADKKSSRLNGSASYYNWTDGFAISVHKGKEAKEVIDGFIYFIPASYPKTPFFGMVKTD